MQKKINLTILINLIILASTAALASTHSLALAQFDEFEAEVSEEASYDAETEGDNFAELGLTIGLKAGLCVPGLFNEMDMHGKFTFELGYMLPVLDKRLAVVFDANYAAPTASQTIDDSRIGESGGQWSYEMTNEQLFLSLGPMFRILPPGSDFVPYVGLYARYYMARSTVKGSGNGEEFGEHEETSGEFGFSGAVGGELRLGPGAALFEPRLCCAQAPHHRRCRRRRTWRTNWLSVDTLINC